MARHAALDHVERESRSEGQGVWEKNQEGIHPSILEIGFCVTCNAKMTIHQK